MPPHVVVSELWRRPRVGEEIVVLTGEQAGWRGVIRFVDHLGGMPTITALMSRPDGSLAGPVAHRADAVGLVLPEVPTLTSVEAAEAWLEANDPTKRPKYPAGTRVLVMEIGKRERVAHVADFRNGSYRVVWLDDLEISFVPADAVIGEVT